MNDDDQMISVQEAEQIIRQNLRTFPIIKYPLEKACGAVLREDLFADRDQPPFDKSIADGLAIKFSAWEKGRREFKIAGIQAAGDAICVLKNENECREIMTGAVVPRGCDCIVPAERISLQNNVAKIDSDAVIGRDDNIHRQGSDDKKGSLILSKNCLLTPARIGVAASIGKSTIKITKKIKIAIVATGDELVEINRPIKSYQTRLSNSYALAAIFSQNIFCETDMFHIKDNVQQLKIRLKSILAKFDAVVLSGGVSMGKFDFVPKALTELRVRVLFHKVAQKPGKPFWFGKSKSGKLVFALPGNPVSTQICAYRYVVPALQEASGLAPREKEWAILNQGIDTKTDLALFLPVKISSQEGKNLITLASISGSGDAVALANADGFVELAAGQRNFLKGTSVRLFRWKT